ncbi:DUF4265 domain-containing protein [Xylophilus rhododendri]|uniref:DUF4265 domain-containing protein n=2 Tax=Xylophilus rhododendri TaxID=2697032 RepID=A0A857JAL2_9BURK|nr:DUF4265 domain-containing protein [Xylophilus rhododendri]
MDTKLVKVLLEVAPADWHSVSTETLWASPMGDHLYQLKNSPFFTKGFSYLDIVRAEFSDDAGFLVVKEVVGKSGHSTYAIWIANGIEGNADFSMHWQSLEKAGCTYEGAHGQLISVDVPASADVVEAFRLMQAGEDAGVWHFQEQNYEHAVLWSGQVQAEQAAHTEGQDQK